MREEDIEILVTEIEGVMRFFGWSAVDTFICLKRCEGSPLKVVLPEAFLRIFNQSSLIISNSNLEFLR